MPLTISPSNNEWHYFIHLRTRTCNTFLFGTAFIVLFRIFHLVRGPVTLKRLAYCLTIHAKRKTIMRFTGLLTFRNYDDRRTAIEGRWRNRNWVNRTYAHIDYFTQLPKRFATCTRLHCLLFFIRHFYCLFIRNKYTSRDVNDCQSRQCVLKGLEDRYDPHCI